MDSSHPALPSRIAEAAQKLRRKERCVSARYHALPTHIPRVER